MNSEVHTIRDYNAPPVIETVLSIQFAPIHGLSLLHFGLYWAKIRRDYPQSELRPALGQTREEFGSRTRRAPDFGLEVVTEPALRCWFTHSDMNQLIQIQKDRFIYNWKKANDTEAYPRYERIKERCLLEWGRFIAFLEEENLGKPEANQCEVTYVNHIDYEQGWKSFGELSKLISPWSGNYSGTFLPVPETIGLNASYILRNNQGRLYVSMQPVIRAKDAKEVLQLTFTARGGPSSSTTEDIFRWLDLGREWVVEGFTDFTTSAFHERWGRTK
nr:TIGR04255 family protein [Nitrosomonas nitrosa]